MSKKRSKQINTEFKFIYSFAYDKEKMDNKNCNTKQLDALEKEFLPYVSNSYKVSYLKKDIKQNIIIENKKIKKYIMLDNIFFYFFDKKAFIVFNYHALKLDDNSILFFSSRLGDIGKSESKIFLEKTKEILCEKEWFYKEENYKKLDCFSLNNKNNKIKIRTENDTPFYCQSEDLISKLKKEIGIEIDIKSTVNEYNSLKDFIESIISPFVNNKNKDAMQEKDKLYLNLLINYKLESEDTVEKILLRRMSNNIEEKYNENVKPLEYSNIKVYLTQKTLLTIEDSGSFSEFFNIYRTKFFYIYLISLYQNIKAFDTINKAIISLTNKDNKKIEEIKQEIVHFLSNTNFSKIINDENGTTLYSHCRNILKINDMTEEIKENIALVSTFLEEKNNKKRERIISTVGVIVAVSQLDSIMDIELSTAMKIITIIIATLFIWKA